MLGEFMKERMRPGCKRVMPALMPMKKLDIAALQQAYHKR